MQPFQCFTPHFYFFWCIWPEVRPLFITGTPDFLLRNVDTPFILTRLTVPVARIFCSACTMARTGSISGMCIVCPLHPSIGLLCMCHQVSLYFDFLSLKHGNCSWLVCILFLIATGFLLLVALFFLPSCQHKALPYIILVVPQLILAKA